MSTSTLIVLVGLIALVAIVGLLPFAKRFVLLLTAKYLVRRRLAWVSLIAVALCTALVLIVLSVMGGWLEMFRSSFKTLTGDVVISSKSPTGFGQYDEIVRGVEALPDVEAAAPIIETAGLLKIPGANWQHYVSVVGVPMDKIDRVMQFSRSLWYQHDIVNYEPTATIRPNVGFDLWDDVPYQELAPKDRRATSRPGMIVGAGAIAVRKDATGRPTWPAPPTSDPLKYYSARLTVVPGGEIESNGAINAATGNFWIVDGSRTQTPQHDQNVYVPFDVLQGLMNMTASTYEDASTDPPTPRSEPAKTTSIHVKIRPGADVNAVVKEVRQVVFKITGELPGSFGRLKVETWEQTQDQFLKAIEHEIALTTTLFALISVVAIFMIFCIFYTIVVEKTRDIGILKAVGGSAWGVAQIFLTYGAAIGLVGGALGIALSFVIVRYINELNALIGRVTGAELYSSDVYAFDKLPDHLNWPAAIVIWVIGIAAAILGAVVPAIRAGRLNPVDALRFE